MEKKKISIVNPCYNEEGNVYAMYQAVKEVMVKLPQYDYEHLFIDNYSKDNTAKYLEDIASNDSRVKVILNQKNFGPARSGAYGLFQATGDVVIMIASDFQDPPELIPEFLEKIEKGYKIVLGQKHKTKTSKLVNAVRSIYYKIINLFSDNDEIEHITGFGAYTKEVIDWFKWIDDPEPFFRNTITDLGYKPYLLQYEQQRRRSGKTSYNFFKYLDAALISLIATSKAPLRISTYVGIFTGLISLLIALFYLIMKLIYWQNFDVGMAPLIIGLFFIGSVQLVCTGILGEYIGAILTRVKKRPLVIEEKRINFDEVNDK